MRIQKGQEDRKVIGRGGSPGLVVKAGDSYSRGSEFKSRPKVDIFTLVCCGNCII